MKKIIVIKFLFLSFSLCALKAGKAVDQSCVGEALRSAVNFFREDISGRLARNSELAKELKTGFQEALKKYKDASGELQFNVHEKVYKEFKPSYYDYQCFMFAVIFQLLRLGYNIDDINNPTNRYGEILLYYWLRVNLLNDDECDKLYETVRPGFYRCLYDAKHMKRSDGC